MKIKSLTTGNVSELISYGLICLGVIDIEMNSWNISGGSGLVAEIEVSEDKCFDLYLTQIGVLGKYIVLGDLTNMPDEIVLNGYKGLETELKMGIYKHLLNNASLSSPHTWSGTIDRPYVTTSPYSPLATNYDPSMNSAINSVSLMNATCSNAVKC